MTVAGPTHPTVYPALTAVMKASRRVVPARLRDRARQWMVQWLDLGWTTRTGLDLRIGRYSDWVIYNEIFVGGEYDRAIELALDNAPPDGAPLQVLDLGANAGFFTLRFVDRLRSRAGPLPFVVTAVEASDAFVRDFRARVIDTNRLADQVRVVPGLAGQRAGSATYFHDAASLHTGSGGVRVPFVDLSAAFAGVPRIDLLKCDIEGSEQTVIESYPDLFQKVQVAVFELHRNLCDTERCKALLAEYGFTHHATFREGDPYFTYGVWR